MADTMEELLTASLFQKVSEICSSVNVAQTSRQLLELSLKQTMELFQAKRGSIFILKENRKDLVLKVMRGMEGAEQEKMVKRLGQGIVGRVAQIKKPVVVEDIASDSRFHDFKARRSYRSPSFICAPLLIKDKLIGVINIADKESGLRFNRNELQLLGSRHSVDMVYDTCALMKRGTAIAFSSSPSPVGLGRQCTRDH